MQTSQPHRQPSKAKRWFIRLLLLSLPLAWLVLDFGLVSCNDSSTSDISDDVSWVKSDKIIYENAAGKIYESRFNSKQRNLLTDHGFDYMSRFHASQNMRYIYYSGSMRGGKEDPPQDTFIYDTKLKQEIAIDNPHPRVDDTAFSPDSTMLARVFNIGIHESNFGFRRHGPYEIVINYLDQRKEVRYEIPGAFMTKQGYRITDLKWSPDSTAIFLSVIAPPNDKFIKFTLLTKEFKAIQGRYQLSTNDMKDYGPHFYENGQELKFFRPFCPQYLCDGQGAVQPGNSAKIDYLNRLAVIVGGHKKIIASGSYSFCYGNSIRIISWLENGSYLVFLRGGELLIYGVAENKIAKLSQIRGDFIWEDNENRSLQVFP
jgi:hypothetical protein